mgnify:FL=1
MKTKKLALAAVSAAVMFASCSKDEVVNNQENSFHKYIGFSTVGSNAQTKATVYTSNNSFENFAVFAYNGTNLFMGGSAETGVNIVKNETAWDYQNSADLAYWPKSTLNFYGVAPLKENTGVNNYSWNIGSDEQKITYTTVDEYGVDAGTTNVDVMYGVKTQQTASSNNGVVKFNFKHILSQILFQAKVQYAAMVVNIEKINVHNVCGSGTFKFPSNESEVATRDGNWTSDGHVNFSVGFHSESVEEEGYIIVDGNNVDNAKIISKSDDNPLLLIPQTLTKWTTTAETKVPISEANINYQSYLEISCKIMQNGEYLFGSESAYNTLYVPFGASWEPGKRYIYTLIFGGGFDVNGDPILSPITFDAEVSDWVDATDNNGDINTSEGGVN